MKKIVLFSLVLCLGFVDAGFAGGFNDIDFRQSGKDWICDINDCYTWDNGKNYLQCDNDKGDVGDHVFAIAQTGKYSKNFTAHECCLETFGDLWRDRSGRFLWCDKADTCKETVAFDYGFEFCAKSRTRDMGSKRPLLVDGGKKTENNQTTIKQYVGCLRCQKDYERPDKDYNFTSRDGCSECKVTRDECVPAEMIDCFKAIDRNETANWNGKSCNCGSRDSVNYSWDSKQKKCVEGPKEGPKTAPEPKKDNYCDKYKKYDKRYACCVAGKSTKWNGTDMSNNGNCECVDKSMTWDGKKCVRKPGTTCEEMYKGNEEAIACCNNSDSSWNSDLKECECNEVNKVWDSELKKCVEKSSPVPSTECTETICKITITQSIKCRYNDNHFTSTQTYPICEEDLKKQNLNGTQCQDFQKLVDTCQNLDCIADLLAQVNAYNQVIAAVCNQFGAPTPVIVSDNSAKIAAAKQTVSSFFGSAESNKSVWKDAQGNFNTARLASDLTAGVVLGTVGGVVSGVVIKKKQIEKGFDALHCAVGGQTVADWGDTFNVGLRR